MAKRRFVIEEQFEYNGFHCVCILNAMAIRVGYVGIDTNHPYYGMDYDENGPDEIMCHFGLTYSDRAYWDDDNNLWWFGFDCGHWGDKYDVEAAMKYNLINETQAFLLEKFHFDNGTLRDVDFVKDNCKLIADQLEVVQRGGVITNV